MKKRSGMAVKIDSDLHLLLKKEALERNITLEKLTDILLRWYLHNENISQEPPSEDTQEQKIA